METTIEFTDGIRVRTDGPFRTVKLTDGWYVAGRGFLLPCDDRDDAKDEVRRLRKDLEA